MLCFKWSCSISLSRHWVRSSEGNSLFFSDTICPFRMIQQGVTMYSWRFLPEVKLLRILLATFKYGTNTPHCRYKNNKCWKTEKYTVKNVFAQITLSNPHLLVITIFKWHLHRIISGKALCTALHRAVLAAALPVMVVEVIAVAAP